MDKLEYLQLMSVLTPLEGFSSEEDALKNTKAKAYLERLAKLDTELKKNEFQFRRQVKQFELDVRLERAAQLAPQKRAAASARAKARTEATNNFLRQMRKRTHGF